MNVKSGAYGTVRFLWTGAEVPALYRMCLRHYGPADEATRDAFRASVNRQEYAEELDCMDARTVADALYYDGQQRAATRVINAVQGAERWEEE